MFSSSQTRRSFVFSNNEIIKARNLYEVLDHAGSMEMSNKDKYHAITHATFSEFSNIHIILYYTLIIIHAANCVLNDNYYHIFMPLFISQG